MTAQAPPTPSASTTFPPTRAMIHSGEPGAKSITSHSTTFTGA